MDTATNKPPASTSSAALSDADSDIYRRIAVQDVKSLLSHEHGLALSEAAARLQSIGPNALIERPAVPVWRKLLTQFSELVVGILIAAAIISGLMGEWIDAVAILAIVVLNGVLGFFQEQKAERAMAALRKLTVPLCKVVREGRVQQIAARTLVPGDLIELEAGDQVPADARLLRTFGVRAQEAALTGESKPVAKSADIVLPTETPLAECRNMVFMGTELAAGKASAVVTATGMHTELGHIARMLATSEPELTPLQRRLKELGQLLVVTCLAIVAVIFTLQLARGGDPLEVALLAISLAVAAVPEGLPAVVTLVLAIGLQRMAKCHALVRKLASVETLGSVTVICADKTGTLTRNEMTARVVVAGDQIYRVTGVGYAPVGQVVSATSLVEALAGPTDGKESADHVPCDAIMAIDLRQLLTCALYCNNARLVSTAGEWKIVGDPTEGALLVLAAKGGCTADPNLRVVHEIPFDSQRKAMSVATDNGQVATIYCKGALEVVLEKCDREFCRGEAVPLDARRCQEILKYQAELAARAMRMLAFAYREAPEVVEGTYQERGLVFLGLVGMTDPVREEARGAIDRCRRAGIRSIMITGDHPSTAQAVAEELALIEAGQRVITGQELDALSDAQLEAELPRLAVFSRVRAEHKLAIVKAWRARGEVVAMTGDGVNDAPAIKAAHVGIAMGLSGTDVTKEASDIILTDDNFASIVNAIEEGRGIYDNIQKFVRYLLTCNSGEVLFMFFAAVFGWPSPLTAVQILWINLITDGLPALALGLEPPGPDIMHRPPRPVRETLITRALGLQIFWQGLLIATVTLIVFELTYSGTRQHLEAARTAAFCVLALSQLFFSFTCRSQRYTLPELGVTSNRYLFIAIAASLVLQVGVVAVPGIQGLFDATDLSPQQWAVVLFVSLMPVTIVESLKLLVTYKKKGPRGDMHQGVSKSEAKAR
ncbi:MAG TPA: cation-translocating P-type ATPase [Pirellulales bacterium]|jgi:Ca2+-transporting ATPase